MKLLDKVINKTERLYSVASTQLDHYTPELCLYGGGALIIAGAVCSYLAGKKIEKEKTVDNFKEEIKRIDSANTGVGPLSKKERGKEKRKATRALVFDISKTIIPPIALTGSGLVLEYIGYKKMKGIQEVLAASLASAVATNKALLDRAGETYGPEAKDILQTNGRYEVIEKTVTDENGEKKTVKDQVLMIDACDVLTPSLGHSFIYSAETCYYGFTDNLTHFQMILKDAENLANRKLQDIQGYLFEDSIVDCFAVEARPQDRVNGYVFDPLNDKLENKVVLDYKDIYIRHEDGSLGHGWLITPNIDGSIIDIYQKYSFKILHKR